MGYIKIEIQKGIPKNIRAQFDTAGKYWNTVITSGAEPLRFAWFFEAKDRCGVSRIFLPGETIQGLLIFAIGEKMDSVGGTGVRAGPCAFSRSFARLGVMKFDTSDLGFLAASESLQNSS